MGNRLLLSVLIRQAVCRGRDFFYSLMLDETPLRVTAPTGVGKGFSYLGVTL